MGFVSKVKQLFDFSLFHSDAQRLLIVNTIFGLILPLHVYFANAFIWRQEHDFTFNYIFNFLAFVGVPSGFILNGFFLKYVQIKKLYFIGMAVSVVSLFCLFFMTKITLLWLAVYGWINGTAMGLYWSNRTYLVLMKTTDGNRNFFTSAEAFIVVMCNVLTPFFAGQFIGKADKLGWFTANQAYQVVICFAGVLVLIAGIILSKGNYQNPHIKRFLYFSYIREWQFMRLYAVVLGFIEGCSLILPILLILKFVGNESALGIVESCSAILSVTVVYVVGRFSQPHHRPIVAAVGVALVASGTLSFGILFSAIGVIILQACNISADPMTFTTFRSTMMLSIDRTNQVEQRDEYAYVIDSETIRNIGRVIGGLLFLSCSHLVSEEISLRYTPVFLALINANTIWICWYLNKKKGTFSY